MNKIIYIAALFLLFSCSETKPEEKKPMRVTATLKWKTDTILKVPESVLYNHADKFIYVSNINGKPDSSDGNGFITRMKLDGSIDKLEWVTGLDDPKVWAFTKARCM
jgi:hypothetical protein